MKKYNITIQFLILYLLHMIVLFVFLVLVVYFASRVHQGTKKVVSENVSSMEATIHLKRQIYHQKEIVYQLMTQGWDSLLMGKLFKEDENFEFWLTKAQSVAYSKQEKNILNNLSLLDKKVMSTHEEFLKKKNIHVESARALIKDYDSMRALCMQMLEVNKNLINQTMAKKDLDLRYMYIAAVASVMVSFGLLFSLFFTRSITRPLRKLVDDAQSVGKYSLEEHDKNIGNEISLLEKQMQHITYLLEDSGKTINEQRQRLLHAERLAAVGELSAKIAHEVRNPLTGIRTSIQLIKRQNQENEPFQKRLNRMIEELNRVERIVSDMLSYSRPIKLNYQKLDLIGLLRESIALVSGNISQSQIRVKLENRGSLMIEADSDLLKQVFYNILQNACENLREGNSVMIKVENVTFDSSSFIHLLFQDDGPGVKPDMLDNIFRPFFTTKPLGTGLGLAICQNIVMEHKGRIWAENGRDGGLGLNIVLPKKQENI